MTNGVYQSCIVPLRKPMSALTKTRLLFQLFPSRSVKTGFVDFGIWWPTHFQHHIHWILNVCSAKNFITYKMLVKRKLLPYSYESFVAFFYVYLHWHRAKPIEINTQSIIRFELNSQIE